MNKKKYNMVISDSEIISILEAQSNKTKFICDAIREHADKEAEDKRVQKLSEMIMAETQKAMEIAIGRLVLNGQISAYTPTTNTEPQPQIPQEETIEEVKEPVEDGIEINGESYTNNYLDDITDSLEAFNI